MMEPNQSPWPSQRAGKVLVLAAALGLAACPQRGTVKAAAPVTPAAPKPVAAPPPPPAPLSTPQTRVELPPPQPIPEEALETQSATPEPPLAKPAAPKRAPASPVIVTPPVATPPVEPPRPAIGEMISPTELKRLSDQVQGRRKEVNQIVEQIKRRHPTHEQDLVMNNIENFLTLSKEAEKRNDIRQADALAERAQILARDLQNGK
jgi:hypothetical protein